MNDSIFTKIIKGEIPCHRVHEDERTLAFLTISPLRPGHVLVIPKKQVDHIWDLDNETYQALMVSVKKVGSRIREVLHPVRVGIQVSGNEVPHVHVHVFPFNNDEEFRAEPAAGEPDHAALAEMAAKLAF